MKSSETNPLEGLVHVDEFEIGTPKKGEQGRSNTNYQLNCALNSFTKIS